MTPRRGPTHCPVCGDVLALTRLSCDDCGTELSGHFPTCEYCGLEDEDRSTLRVFLSSRGNMKEVERHLGVSYPTARARFDAIIKKLGFDTDNADGSSAGEKLAVLEELAEGNLTIEEALHRLG